MSSPTPTSEVVPAPTREPRLRSSAIDAVRVLATATVVAAHAFSAHAWTHYVWFSWHVPIFCVLSGYLWSRRRTMGAELRRRARTLLVPYFSWLLLVTAAWWIVSEHRGHPLDGEFFENLVRGGSAIVLPYSPYWFITALFFACLYARFLGSTWLVGLAGVVGLVAIEVWPRQLQEIPMAAGLALPCLVFLACGMALRQVRDRIRTPLLVGPGLLGCGIALLSSGIDPLDLKQADLGTPGLTALAGAAIAVGLILTSEGLFVGRAHHVRALSVLATAVMPVVLGHTLVLGVFADVPLDAPVWVFILALVGPWTFGLVAARIPALRAVLL